MAADLPPSPSDRRSSPPALGRALAALVLPGAVRDDILGDLEERFAARARAFGRLRALLWYWGQVARLRPFELRRALRTIDDGSAWREDSAVEGSGMITGWRADLRHALRALRARPGFSITVAATVALAIGATTSVFSVVDGVLLRPLDFPEPERLVRAWQTMPSWKDDPNPQLRAFADQLPLSVPTFNDWKEARTGLESLGIYTGDQYVYRGSDGAEMLHGIQVTSGVFEALGVPALLGRSFVPEDDAVGAPAVAVLSHRLWRDRFGADPAMVGRSISLDGEPVVVVGVMPEGFDVPGWSSDLWTELAEERKTDERDNQSFTVLGRLRPGATVARLEEDLVAVQARLSEVYPDEQEDHGAHVEGLLDSMVGDVRSTLLFLLGAVVLVLLIACVNIANMLSVMGLVRRRELSVRAALGAGRGRLVRGLLTESAVLAGVGGLGGIAISMFTLPLLTRMLPATLPRTDAIGIDARVLVFGIALTALTALVAGVLPAIQVWGTEPRQVMDATGRGLAGGRAGERARSVLVIAEVALAFSLLVGATLLGISFVRLWNVDRGFATEGLIAMTVVPDPLTYPEREDQTRFRSELRERLQAIPGVRVSVANQIPLSGSASSTTYHLDRPDGAVEDFTVMISVVGEDYLEVLGVPLLEGRPFGPADFEDGPTVGIVNKALADRYWPGESAVGKTLRKGKDADGPETIIIGVAANVRHQALAEPAQPKLYVTLGQNERWAFHWLIRAQGDPSGVVELARQAVSAVSPATPVRDTEILDEHIARSVSVQRFRTYFVVGLAGMATVLALLGVYGVLSFAVSQRTRELAVRMAIGAHPAKVVTDTLTSGVRLSAGGVVLGMAITWWGARLVKEFLFEIDVGNPIVYIAAAALIGGVGALASYLPARRASRVDPASVLNAE